MPLFFDRNSLASQLARRYPRDFTFYLGNPVSSIETRSAPALLSATHRAFTFYLGNPVSSIPLFLIQKSTDFFHRIFDLP